MRITRLKKTIELIAIDSPSGHTREAAEWVKNAFETLGFSAELTVKGGVMINLGGRDDQDGLMLAAHADTLGGMVAEIKSNGRLRLTNLIRQSAARSLSSCSRKF